MSLKTKTFFGLLIFMMSFLDASAMQETDMGLAWYQRFFKESKEPYQKTVKTGHFNLRTATEEQDEIATIKALKELGLIYLTRTSELDSAMDFFIQALALEDSFRLREDQVFTYLAMAEVFTKVGDHQKSAELLEQAKLINEEFMDVNILVLIMNEMGKNKASTGDLEGALEHYKIVLANRKAIHPQAVAEAQFNLAHLQTIQGNYDQALQDHKRALRLRRSLRDKAGEAKSLNDIGELYRLMKNDAKALANHVVALQIRQHLGDKEGIAESYNNIGEIYSLQQNYSRAIANLELALIEAQESQSHYQQQRSHEYLAFCFEKTSDFQRALEHQKLFTGITDFIQNGTSEQLLLEKQNRYVLEKKEVEIDKLEKARTQKEKQLYAQKKLSNFLFAVAVLTIIIVLLILYAYIQNRRSGKVLEAAHSKVNQQNLELQELNATKDKFFSIISHDLKGPLNSLTSFSGLLINHTDSLSKDEIKMLATDLDKSVKNLFALLVNLLEWSRSQTGNIEFTPEVFDFVAMLEENRSLLQAQAQNKKINLERRYKDKLLVEAHRHSITTVVRNLMSNAIKFTPKGGSITVGLKQENMLLVSVADTGVGMTQEVMKKLFRIDTKHTTKGTADEKGTGLGLILCKEFIEKNGGQIWVESEVGKGSVFYFTVPYSNHIKEASPVEEEPVLA